MSIDEAKSVADARLDEALRTRGYADPRAEFRARLRELKARSGPLFEDATRHYEETVVPSVAAGADPLETWVAYGRFLGELSGSGRVLSIDATGRATSDQTGAGSRDLILFVPDDARASVLALARPSQPSAAQRATYDLLVAGRLSL